MSSPESRTAVVTGASSGIGEATARALGALGWPVAIGARRVDRLKEIAGAIETAGGSAFHHPLDVSVPQSIDDFFDAVEKELGSPDVVVNNAGVGIPRLLHEAGVEELQTEIAINLLGPMLVSRRAIPQAGYTASKAGVEGLARVLQMELEGTGVRSTIVRPGPTGTEFGVSYSPELSRRILESWKHWGIIRRLDLMPAESVARAVVSVLTAPPGMHLDLVQVMPENTQRGPL
jgi:NAD(P)-dependent dehydrogenase (short-subunit alcohol dehydrogenase family)